jgi:hypothetical protein
VNWYIAATSARIDGYPGCLAKCDNGSARTVWGEQKGQKRHRMAGRVTASDEQSSDTGNTSRNNVPNKTLLVGTFVCAVLGTLRSRFCVPDTVLVVPDIIWNIPPNNIWHIFLISDFGS